MRLPAPYKTKCQQKKLPGIGSYTKDGCLYQCVANVTLEKCGCRMLGMPGKITLSIYFSIKYLVCLRDKSPSGRSKAYLGFCSMKRLEVVLLPLDGVLVYRTLCDEIHWESKVPRPRAQQKGHHFLLKPCRHSQNIQFYFDSTKNQNTSLCYNSRR